MKSLFANSVCISGLTSFTGLNIANYLDDCGYKVCGSFPGEKANYKGIKEARLKQLNRGVHLTEAVRSTDDSMLEWIDASLPEVWIHHFHYMNNWRSKDYDMGTSKDHTIVPLKKILEKLKSINCKGLIYSSSIFEKSFDEVAENKNTQPKTPYSESKFNTWTEIKRISLELGLPVIRIMMPNPIGPGENEDRLIPSMMRHAYHQKKMKLNSTKTLTHNISIYNLTKVYKKAVDDILANKVFKMLEVEPDSWTISVYDFCRLVNEELLVKRLGLNPCEFETPETESDSTLPLKQEESDNSFSSLNSSICELFDSYTLWLKSDVNNMKIITG